MPGIRAKAGGQTVAGQHFKGGQFIPLNVAMQGGLIKAEVRRGIAKVKRAVQKGKYETFQHAARSIRKDAISSIRHTRRRNRSSRPGKPAHQHKPGFFKRAIFYHVSHQDAMIGFVFSRVGEVAAIHEHGLTRYRRRYPERPTMGPALERNVVRFHRDWRAAIG